MFIEQPRYPWQNLRSNVTSDDTLLTTFEYNNATYLANKFDICRAYNTDYTTALIAFWGKAANNSDAKYVVYGRRSDEGPIEVLAGSKAGEVITLGAMAITNDPIAKSASANSFWADTIANTHVWAQADTICNAADHIAYLVLPLAGIRDICCLFDLDGGVGTAMTAVTALITGY